MSDNTINTDNLEQAISDSRQRHRDWDDAMDDAMLEVLREPDEDAKKNEKSQSSTGPIKLATKAESLKMRERAVKKQGMFIPIK